VEHRSIATQTAVDTDRLLFEFHRHPNSVSLSLLML
jgi:hypothetical protein